MVDQKERNIEHEFHKLQKRFSAGLADTFSKITSLTHSLCESHDLPVECIKELHLLYHNLAGSAKVFKMLKLGSVAQKAAEYIGKCEYKNNLENSECKATLLELLSALEHAANGEPDLYGTLTSKDFNTALKNGVREVGYVYLVEDDIDQAEHVRLSLERAGFKVLHYRNTIDFESANMTENFPIAIIMDIIFPEDSNAGLTVMTKLNRNIFPSVPIVYTSVRTDMEARLKALRAGSNRYLTKPIDVRQLVAMLEGMTHKVPANPYRILLVDDEIVLAEYYANLLHEAGMEARVVTNPLESLEVALEFDPDVIVSDIYMPDCSGTELAIVLREHESLAQIPVVFLSSEANIEKQVAALDTGADQFLKKPVDALHFVGIVRAKAQRSRHYKRINFDLKAAIQERDFQQMALNQHAVVSTTDATGTIIYANDKFCDISGYERWELIGHNHRIIKSNKHSMEFYSELWQTISSGKVWHGEICNRKKNGEFYWMESTIVPFLDENGIPNQYISVRTDITKIKTLQQRMIKSEERFRRSQLFANIGTWEWNIKTGEIYWSECIAPLFGYSEQVPVTTYRKFLAAIHPEDRETVTTAITDCVENGAEYDIVHRVLWRDGSVRWLREKGDVVRGEKGEALKMLGAVQDVTLEHESLDALKLAQESADKANKAKSEFLSSMSHELRTPLNAILGFGQLLALNHENTLTNNQRNYIEEIQKAGDHLLGLIDEVLDLAKIEAGRVNLIIASVDLFEIVAECISLVQPMADKYNVTIINNINSSQNINVSVDASRFKQIILNLLSNAIKYNREDGEVNLNGELFNNKVKISVTDTGMGLKPEEQSHLFKPFDRIGAENTEIEGTGIGLVITQHLIQMMDGNIGFESQYGEGSTFWIEVKTADNTFHSETYCIHDESEPHEPNKATNTSCKILYIEDNPTNLRLVEHVLKKHTYIELISAHSASLGIELALAKKPDIVLLDINLPGMDGYSVLKKFRNSADMKNIPVIAVSANAMESDLKKGKQAGFDEYLTKPIDIHELLTVVEKYCSIKRANNN